MFKWMSAAAGAGALGLTSLQSLSTAALLGAGLIRGLAGADARRGPCGRPARLAAAVQRLQVHVARRRSAMCGDAFRITAAK